MPFPQHPEKHRWPALYSASDFRRYQTEHHGTAPPEPPPTVVLVFGGRWARYLRRRFPKGPDRRTGVYREGRSTGIVHVEGPGAPFVGIVVEELAALGVNGFVIVGLAGSLRPELRLGSLVVCGKAVRDEGTSHHYQRPSRYAYPDRRLTDQLVAHLTRTGTSFLVGPSWTTDAPYRETVPEIRKYRHMGVLTVEMEASAVFAIAGHLGLRSAALFVISDHLDESGWEPRFYDTQPALEKALHLAIRACQPPGSDRTRRVRVRHR